MPTGSRNAKSVQVAIRIPRVLYDALLARERPIGQQVVEALRAVGLADGIPDGSGNAVGEARGAMTAPSANRNARRRGAPAAATRNGGSALSAVACGVGKAARTRSST